MSKKMKFCWLILFLIGVNVALYFVFMANRYRWIVVHHSAGDSGNYESIREYHRKRHGWTDAGYHLLLSNGNSGVGNGFLEATGRFAHLSYALATRSPLHNVWGIHLCIIGNYEKHPVPARLHAPIGHAITLLQDKYGIPDDRVLFHRDVGQTACPGKFVTKGKIEAWKAIAKRCPEAIREQQAKAVDGAGFSLHTIPWVFVAVSSCVSLFVVLCWGVASRPGSRRIEKDQEASCISDLPDSCDRPRS